MPINDQALLRDILLWLHRKQEILERESQASQSDEAYTYAMIATVWRKIENDRALEHALQATEGSLVGDDKRLRYIYLEPTPRDNTIPILSLSYDWTLSIPLLSLRVGLFLLDSTGSLAATGYRFESPHSRGNHHFYHAQPIRSFDKGDVLLPQCPEWLPIHQPSFVLDATNPISLLMCLLISLYGFNYIDTLRSAPFGNDLFNRVEGKMSLLDPELQPTFWKVDSAHGIDYYMTQMSSKRFKEVIKLKYGAVRISSLRWQEYSDLEEGQKQTL